MEARWKGDFITGLAVAVLAGLGIFWLIPAQTEPAASGVYDLSPRLVPRLSLALCLLLGLGLSLRAWHGGRRGRAAPRVRHLPGGDAPPWAGLGFDLAVWVGSSVLVMLVLGHAGFIVTGGLLLAGWLFFAGVRSLPVVAAIALLLPVALERLCWWMLTVELP